MEYSKKRFEIFSVEDPITPTNIFNVNLIKTNIHFENKEESEKWILQNGTPLVNYTILEIWRKN